MYALPRLLLSLAAGASAGAVAFLRFHHEREAIALVGWSAFCAAWLAITWLTIRHKDGECSEELAMREDEGRAVSSLFVTIGSLVSLFGVALALGRAGELARTSPRWQIGLSLLAFLTVLLTWLAIQTLYTLHYARLYYTEPRGGIHFDDTEEPSYTEFAYVAFTIGMTYQVSDTNLSKRAIRRLLLHHALLSYLFSTVLVALTINAVAGLVAGGR